MQKALTKAINLDQVLVWESAKTALDQIVFLCEAAPLRSVVLEVHPSAATAILRDLNPNNRRMAMRTVKRVLVRDLQEDAFKVTGDTIKFSRSGILMDGQHRLSMCANGGKPFRTHAVFGLDDDLFEVLDQGRRRSAGDILGQDSKFGVNGASIAAAIRWVVAIRESKGSNKEGMDKKPQFTPRGIRALAQGEVAGIDRWCKAGALVRAAYKHPPSLITAILYLIAEHRVKLAEQFAYEWVQGAKVGRNEAFDVLGLRLLTIARQNNGHINNQMRAALIIITFNYWNANKVPSPAALQWRKSLKFPQLRFNGPEDDT